MALILATSACHVDGSPTPVSTAQKSAHPGAFPNRVNPGNDGSSYEPCAEANRNDLEQLGWEWSTRRDAALVDKQTARGCVWKDSSAGSRWTLSQVVGNSPSLTAYRRTNSDFDWQPDQTVGGRTVAVYVMDSSTCVTRVQSQRAGVNTIVSYNSLPAPPISEICSRAIAFTRATISRMPE
ncbi:DUF3558 family protein [Gordonia araii]|uniref:DUF3558 family protein n=1 Tax=Gordonia araii TaxID=263909 RepID=UPI000A03344C|nr:DUF3558 family protein [Gordonia araii NBRC 100433]